MQTIKDILSGFKYSKYQLYRRIEKLEGAGIINPSRGDRNEILLTDEEVNTIELLEQLESHKSIDSAITQLENEKLKMENERLREKAQRLTHEIQARDNIIQRLRGTIFVRLRQTTQKIVQFFK